MPGDMRFGYPDAPGTRGKEFEDQLTGLPNRRFLDRVVDGMIREGTRFALLFIDLDGFKLVNDTLGHVTGDEVLVEFAALLRSAVRPGDTACRHGGDEFVVIARVGAEDAAEALAERLTTMTGDTLKARWNVTASTGFAFFPDDASDKRSLLICADAAMYRAKSSGGGRWCRSESDHDELAWNDSFFAGRPAQVAEVTARLASPARGVLFVTGETGMGKSALMTEALERSGMSSRTLRLACRPEFARIPYAPLIGGIRAAARTLGAPALPRAWEKVLGTVLPDIYDVEPMEGTLERVVLMEAVSALMASWEPVAVVVEDAHWLDQGTAEFLAYLVRFGQGDGIPVFVLARKEELGGGTGIPVASLLDMQETSRLELDPLDRREIVELARGCLGTPRISADLASLVGEVSGGNPLFAKEFLRSVHQTGRVFLRDGQGRLTSPEFVPATQRIRDLVNSKIARLDSTARTVVTSAAVAGGISDPDLLSAITGLSEGEVMTALDAAAAMGILVQDARDPLAFDFRNLTYREEIARAAQSMLVKRVNLALAEMYVSRGDHYLAAISLERAGELSRAAAMYTTAGMEALERRLDEEGTVHLEKALRLHTLVDRPGEGSGGRVDILTRLGMAYVRLGRMELAYEHHHSASELLARLGRNEEAVESSSRAAEILRLNGLSQRSAMVQKELERTATGRNLLRVLLRELDAVVRLGSTEEAERIRERVESLWRETGRENRDLRSYYHHKMMLYHITRMELEVALSHCRAALAAPHSRDMDWFLHNDCAEALILQGSLRAAGARLRLAELAAAEMPSIWGAAWASTNAAMLLFLELRHQAAWESLDRTWEMAERTSDQPLRSCIEMIRGRILLDRGLHEEASTRFENSFALSPQLARGYFRSIACSAAGRLEEALENAEMVVEEIGRPGRMLQIESGTLLTGDDCMVQLLRARMALGDDEALDDLIDRIPMLKPRQALEAASHAVPRLHAGGGAAEAAALLEGVLSRPGAGRETRGMYLALSSASAWDRSCAARAARLRRRMDQAPRGGEPC